MKKIEAIVYLIFIAIVVAFVYGFAHAAGLI